MGETSTHSLHDTLAADLGAHAPKPTATTPDLTEAARSVWSDDRIDTGLWECTPGSFAATREGYTEICTILAGRVTLEVDGAEPEEFGPGDVMVTPSGWRGTWIVHEPLRKHYTIVKD
ncbi:DUF861 domain-containing protein [Leucobacter sp. CSA1]|uniref:DUF861 domain-containing protein n=1 Tax=Leucobacter chromiisoli TaxID=2796471 RepID=A0A934UWP2_9MICO|nr:cupin domain-containing protein [Leucobacter chromiisoli]MBK0420122.1 DUF861 domain-containing protein [Leucobacter chromiisoli]